MLKRFEVRNYKNFEEKIIIDFEKVGGYQFSTECIYNRMISKMLIYGRNATGKTNLGSALFDVAMNLSSGRYLRIIRGIYLNADSKDKCAEFKYVFQFDEDEVIYKYRKFTETQLLDEELFLNDVRCFYYNFENQESDFQNLNLLNADTVVIERYLEAISGNDKEDEDTIYTLPFIRWLVNNTALPNDSILLKLDGYVNGMAMITVGNTLVHRPMRAYGNLLEILSDENEMKDFEDFLNIMGIKCKLVLRSLPDDQKELYFKHQRLVPFFENASSGTISLVSLYRRFQIGKTASLMYIDEFDAFYHYEMAENVIKFFKKKYPKCQVIVTTHNTNLMTNRLMRPDCLFILSRSGTLTALSDATPRELREGHNLEKLYISGEFEKYE